ncbi:MAG: hypothetical protein LAO20_05175 [Acidobacteriia bacterium]|nr:hypothetical protein [Terriglobia bacterium]
MTSHQQKPVYLGDGRESRQPTMNEKHKQEIAAAKVRKAEEKAMRAREERGREDAGVRERIVRIATALLFAVVSMTTSLPLLYALPVWALAILALVYVSIDAFTSIRKFGKSRKLAISFVTTCLFFYLGRGFIMSRYMLEQSAKTSGYISARNPNRGGRPALEFGDSGVIFPWWENNTPLSLLKEAGLILEKGENGIEISTVIRDRFGRRVMKIEKNHWTVDAPNSVDKNHTDDALEVLDGGDHVVFQVRMLPDRVQLRGEWHDEFGHGVQITECRDEIDKLHGCVQIFGERWQEQDKRTILKRIFEYPSSEHLGQFSKGK